MWTLNTAAHEFILRRRGIVRERLCRNGLRSECRKNSRIARPMTPVESPAGQSLPLVELFVDTKAEFFELMVRLSLRVLEAMPDQDRRALYGPRYAHQPARAASSC